MERSDLAEHREIHLAIAVVEEDRLLPVSACVHVVDPGFLVLAWGTWHGRPRRGRSTTLPLKGGPEPLSVGNSEGVRPLQGG